MKRVISLLLALVICLSLCACGGNKLELDADDVRYEFKKITQAGLDLDLDIEESKGKVKSFVCTIDDIDVTGLQDEDYIWEAVDAVQSGDTSRLTRGKVDVASVFVAFMSIDTLLLPEIETRLTDDVVDWMITVVYDGKTVKWNGWKVSAEVDEDNNCVTISVVSK